MSAIPAGYKQTDVGVIPVEWAIEPLGLIGQWFSGGTPSLSNASYWSGSVPWVSPKDMKLPRLWDAIDHISLKAISDGARVLPVGAVLMVIRGMILAHSLPVARVERPLAINQDIKAVVTRNDFDSNFVLYWLMANKQRLLSLTTESTHGTKRLPSEVLFREDICRPPLPEQSAIAATLSDVDALLAKLDQLIAKKRDLKQAAMQQLLTGRTRLPGFSGEWEVGEMKALGNTYGGLAGKTKVDFGRGDARYIPFMNVMTDTVIDPHWLEHVDVAPDEVQNLTKKGDLFFNGSSETPEEVGFCSVLLEDISNLYLNSFCFGFRFNTEAQVNGLFFAYWFRSKDGRKAMSVLAQGATRYNIAKSAFLRLEIPQPSAEEQAAIATVLSDMDAEITALEARRDKTRALKQGMMQELLTGRIRLV